MKTYVINSEADHMKAIVELKKIDPSKYKEGQLRIEVHVAGEDREDENCSK